MPETAVRRSGATALGVAGVVAAGLLGAAPAQAAAPFTVGVAGVNVRTEPTTDSPVVTTLQEPTTVEVDCQASGETITAGGATSSWWAHVPELGGFVTVVYIDGGAPSLPGVPECGTDEVPPSAGDVTLAEVQELFGSRIADPETVAEGLPGLNAAMRAAEISTPESKAAFLATLVHESRLEYDIREIGDTRPYGGRGYIQLTGEFNYDAAGTALGVDLVAEPELARSLEWSAAIATWYWTGARDINPMADALDMGAVNAAIGYPVGNGAEDAARCASFATALEYYTGEPAGAIGCDRPTLPAGGRPLV